MEKHFTLLQASLSPCRSSFSMPFFIRPPFYQFLSPISRILSLKYLLTIHFTRIFFFSPFVVFMICVDSFIHSFAQYLLNASYGLHTVLISGDKRGYRT